VVNYPSDIEPLELGQNYTKEQMVWHKMILRDPHLMPSDKVVAGLIMHMINRQQGYAYPAFEYLAEETQLSRSTVKRALNHLRDLGWIGTEKVGRNQPLRYYLTRSPNRCTMIEEAQRSRQIERQVRRETRVPQRFGSLVGSSATLLKAHGRPFSRVADEPAGGVVSGPQTHFPIPPTENQLISNSFERAASHSVNDGFGHAMVIEAGLTQEEIYLYLGRHLVGWSKVPVEKKEAAVYQIVAQGLTREQAGQMAEALGCYLSDRSF